MNMNPSLVLGLAIAHVSRTEPLMPGDASNAELRVYMPEGSGYYHVRAGLAGRWYIKESADADQCVRCCDADLAAAISAGGQVQLVGYHGRPLATWSAWSAFAAAVQAP